MAKKITTQNTKKPKAQKEETTETVIAEMPAMAEESTKDTVLENLSGTEKNENRNMPMQTIITAILTIVCCVLIIKYGSLSTRVKILETDIAQMEGNLTKNVDDNRKIYVFNMDDTVKGIGLQEANQKFETDINDLDAQVKEAQATIKDLKDEAMKAKILNLSIKPLQMKRDDLLDAYSKSMQQSLAQINEALAEIATENNVPTIFMSKSVAVNTNYVVDVTEQVVAKIKAKNKQ
ncbi:MAG: OmpH family outer membrane protein [Alphaproteobacteria bacterium]|nr:OmpH family outer membrane protein [Alphaproteobacteria bacterium]